MKKIAKKIPSTRGKGERKRRKNSQRIIKIFTSEVQNIQIAQWPPGGINANRSTHRPVTAIMSQAQDRENIGSSKWNQLATCKKKNVNSWLLRNNWDQKAVGWHSKCQKKIRVNQIPVSHKIIFKKWRYLKMNK